MDRKETYEKRRKELEEKCKRCHKQSNPSWDRCHYHCSIGRKIRMLEAEYADITGWSHNTW